MADLQRHGLVGLDQGRDLHLVVMLFELEGISLEKCHEIDLQCQESELIPNLDMSAYHRDSRERERLTQLRGP